MNVLALSDSFEYLCYGSTAIRYIFTLTVRGSTLVVRIWRLQTSDSDDWSLSPRCKGEILTTKVDPRAVRAKIIIWEETFKALTKLDEAGRASELSRTRPVGFCFVHTRSGDLRVLQRNFRFHDNASVVDLNYYLYHHDNRVVESLAWQWLFS